MEAATHDHFYILYNLIAKDFRIRYRNMSLGIFWSLLNPMIMVAVLTFVFTKLLPQQTHLYPLFLLIGLIPFNFFTLAWATGTNSIIDNAALVKKVRFHREIIPISVVLGNVVHFLIQVVILLALLVAFGRGINRQWFWLPVIFGLEIIFACGMALACSALDVHYRDTRYLVESASLVLFWMSAIVYDINVVPVRYSLLYQFNPLAAVVLACRRILLYAMPPEASTLRNLTLVSFGALVGGLIIFSRMKKHFADYL